MKPETLLLGTLLICTAALAQRPSDPALMIPQVAPPFDYVAVPNPLPLPPGVKIGAPSTIRFDSKGHMFVLNRGPQALAEFGADGKFTRLFGDGLLNRAHGLRIDKDDNLWVTDGNENIVMKLDRQGEILLTIGTKGEAGEWNEATGSHHLNQPNDLVFGRNSDIFIVQGHTAGGADPRVLKFDKDGKFIKSWGGRGTEPGKFTVAHGIAVDAQGLLWVADRENQRVQIFDQDGTFVRELHYSALPCALYIGEQYIYMVNGFGGQVLRLDLSGKVLGAVGRSGKGVGEFNEAHAVTVSPSGEIWASDSQGNGVQKFVKK